MLLRSYTCFICITFIRTIVGLKLSAQIIYDFLKIKFPFILIITELNEGYRVANTVHISKFSPTSKYPLCWKWEEILGWKRISPQVTLYGGLSRFQPQNQLPCLTWGILRNGVESCHLECSCNSVMLIKSSNYHHERKSMC